MLCGALLLCFLQLGICQHAPYFGERQINLQDPLRFEPAVTPAVTPPEATDGSSKEFSCK